MQETGNNLHTTYKSIRLSTDGLSFFGASVRNIPFARPDLRFMRCMSYCLCDAWLQESAPETIWIYSPDCQLIPSGLFDDRQAGRLLRAQIPQASGAIRQERLREGVSMVWCIPTLLDDFLSEQFPGATISHPDIPLIRSLVDDTASQQCTGLYIHPQSSTCTMAWANCGQLIGYNRFATPTDDDLLYYVGAVLQNLKCPQTDIHALLFENDRCLEQLQQRIPQIQFQSLPPCAL